MDCVIQEEKTGCGIASIANILGKSYSEMKDIANSMGIFAEDERLWSDTKYVRDMLNCFGVITSDNEKIFQDWCKLPDLALLSIKYRIENGRPLWHWVVFKRENDKEVVLDSADYIENNLRTDFHAMQPAWYIEIKI
jgi:hypothetical protein